MTLLLAKTCCHGAIKPTLHAQTTLESRLSFSQVSDGSIVLLQSELIAFVVSALHQINMGRYLI